MTLTRREFVQSTLIAGAAAGLACATEKSVVARRAEEKPALKKILILGGTAYLGPELVEAARAHGHTLTLFNRGKTNPGLFPDIEKLRGDRTGDLKSLEGRSWDAVIDTSGFVPRWVKLSADLLAPNVGQYVFVSSISVYPEEVPVGIDESFPVQTLPEPNSEDVRKYYGPLKALCEKAAEAAMPGRVTNIRPGLISGPTDPTDRFTYWPVRISRGGEVLAPPPGDPAQLIDVRDLAAWIIHCVEQRTVGVFNATGPAQRMSIKDMLEGCQAASKNDSHFTWVDGKFLEAQKVEPWGDLPVWTGSSSPGFASIANGRAVRAGLTFRPIADTAKDCLAWFLTLPPERQAKLAAGLSPIREKAALEAWHTKPAP